MINLNNLIKILFLLILSSCTITSIETVEDKKVAKEVPSQEYFKKADVNISPLVEYEIEFTVSEKFVFDERINGNNIHHSKLPIPSVIKLSDPKNLNNSIIVRNIKLETENRLSLSKDIIDQLSLNTNVYLEFLKDESIILRNVVDSKEESKIKMDDTEISFENLDEDQTEISEKLDYEKIKSLEIKNLEKINTILVNIYENIKTAKLKTNKIKNLGLLYEENDEGVMVFAGPFPNNDIDLKLDFLIKNGYVNAKKTR